MAGETIVNVMPNYELGLISQIRKEFQAAGVILNIQPYDIVVETLVNNNFAGFTYEMGVRRNMRPLETALGDNDGFIMTHMAIGLYKEDNTLAGNFKRGGNSQPFYYPDAYLFSVAATDVNVSESDALEANYKGMLTAKADQKEVLLELPTYRFRKVPRTQLVTAAPVAKPSYFGEQFEEMFLPIIWEGKKTNRWTFAPAAQADLAQAGGAANTQNVLQIIKRGYIIRDFCESITLQEFRKQMPTVYQMLASNGK